MNIPNLASCHHFIRVAAGCASALPGRRASAVVGGAAASADVAGGPSPGTTSLAASAAASKSAGGTCASRAGCQASGVLGWSSGGDGEGLLAPDAQVDVSVR